MSPEHLGSSFRDPSGFLFEHDGTIYRHVDVSYRADYDLLHSSGLYEQLTSAGMLVAHEEVEPPAPPPDGHYRTLLPEQLDFVSYPYEWSFSALKHAAPYIRLFKRKVFVLKAGGAVFADAADTRALMEQLGILHRRLLAIVRDDDVCRRLMTVPGVGPVVALTYRATIDVPARFWSSKAVGAVLGLTPSKYQSGEIDRTGSISRCGDEMMRAMLYEAAQTMLVRSKKWSWLKAWAMQIARRRGVKKAIVALARRLAVIMHRIWVEGTEFRWTREVAAA